MQAYLRSPKQSISSHLILLSGSLSVQHSLIIPNLPFQNNSNMLSVICLANCVSCCHASLWHFIQELMQDNYKPLHGKSLPLSLAVLYNKMKVANRHLRKQNSVSKGIYYFCLTYDTSCHHAFLGHFNQEMRKKVTWKQKNTVTREIQQESNLWQDTQTWVWYHTNQAKMITKVWVDSLPWMLCLYIQYQQGRITDMAWVPSQGWVI